MQLTREQIRELAEFDDNQSCALTFYFQPEGPRNKAHKDDAILIKDLVREARRNLEKKSKNECAAADLDRIAQISSEFRSNGTHGKAIFACAARKFWREFDVPPQLSGTQLVVDRRFRLRPLARVFGTNPSMGIVVVDRHRARLFELNMAQLTECEGLFQPMERRGRSDGFAGMEGGRAQRRVEDEALHHFKNVAAMLKRLLEKGRFTKWVLGSQEACRWQLVSQLNPNVSAALLGHFQADVSRVRSDELRGEAERVLRESQSVRCREVVEQTLDEAKSHRRGVTGLRRVLRSLELGEVQSLMIGENFLSHAVECSACGHLDAHLVSFCPVCGKATHEVVDVAEAILPRVLRREIEVFYVKDDPAFDQVGNIAALLRFRAEQGSNVRSISTGMTKQSEAAQPEYIRRPRRFASR